MDLRSGLGPDAQSSSIATAGGIAPQDGSDSPDSPSTSFSTPGQQQSRDQEYTQGHYDHLDQHDQHADGAADAKKSRACEACRGLKVRCEPDLDDETAPCKRCKKAGRNCVVTAPTRKRQKKTDSRVSELEKKIDALTASLQARAAPLSQATAHAHRPSTDSHTTAYGGGIWSNNGPRGSVAGGGWAGDSSSGAASSSPGRASLSGGPQQRMPSVYDRPPDAVAGMKRKGTDLREDESSISPARTSSARNSRPDMIERGLITTERAAELFLRYKNNMLRHLPAVVFPPSTSVMELRRSKPYLFLAIMAASSSESPALQRTLQQELLEMFAEKIVVVGEKNMELVQALQVAVIWYWPPEHFEELKFYQLVHMAAVMALDIGLGKKSGARRGMQGFSWREHPFRRHPQPDPTSLECRRAWLTCHFLSANTAMSLHRPNLIRWTPFMTESFNILRSSPDAAPTDKYLCHLIWSHRMAEDIGVQLSMDDPDASVNILDPRTQYTLRGLERDLDVYVGSVPQEMMQPSLKMTFSVLSLYMHELALQTDTSTEQIRPPFSTDVLKDSMVSSEPLSASHINALSACLTAIDSIFETFLGMDISAIRCLPVFTFVRVAYAVVILMKMYFSAASSASELGKVINKDNMRVAYYLDALLEKFNSTAADEKCRPASKFLLVLVMLRSWFIKHGRQSAAGTGLGGAGPGTATPSGSAAATPAREASQQPASTPLQVLSEVAMGRESSAPRGFYNSIPGTNSSNTGFYGTTGSPAATGSPPGYAQHPPPQHQQPVPASQEQWMAQQQQQQQLPFANDFSAGLPQGLDFDSLNAMFDTHDVSGEQGAKMALNDPLFMDMFQGMPDVNLFTL